ncbi:MAG: cytochrome c oxidase subunit 3 family protein [Pyrinomonadaceae bacterium]
MSNHSTAMHQHQFADPKQQFEASSLGMWIFLMTELLLFGGLFAVYVVYRTAYPDAFAFGSSKLEWPLAAANTIILIVSSLTMVLAVYGAQVNNRAMQVGFLFLTILFGAAFLGLKVVEYRAHWIHHEVPGFGFRNDWQPPVQMFFLIYFSLTGIHAVHMVVGIGLVSYVMYKAYRRTYSPAYHTPVEMVGLYWHFVDIAWVFLFPLLYLIGAHFGAGE